jgi:16S rRNA (guanine966-N2)-methyltransferase
MRIIAGEHRGRALVAPRTQSTRPTADRTRQAIFNVLEHAAWARSLAGARALDIFAGSGALGLEALSRGAGFCLFIDVAPEATWAIERSVLTLDLARRARIVRRDAARLGAPATDPFDLVFLDPPYGQDLVEPVLKQLRPSWARPGAIVVAERGAREGELEAPGYACLDRRTWGAAEVWFLEVLD